MSKGMFILSPGSCLSGRTWGCWGVKNLSVGICDGAPLTARFSSEFVISNPSLHTIFFLILFLRCSQTFDTHNLFIIIRNIKQLISVLDVLDKIFCLVVVKKIIFLSQPKNREAINFDLIFVATLL